MKPAPFIYHDPNTVEEARKLLSTLENARVLAGGQSLIPMMNFRVVSPDHVVDINRISALRHIRINGSDLEIGAGTRQRDLEFSPDVAACCPLILAALAHVGHRQTRNRGTIGGSLCHLDPSAELPMIALATDATMHIEGKDGRRSVPMAEFTKGFMTTALEPDELLTEVTIPTWPGRSGYGFVEFARRRGDFAIVAVAALLAVNERGLISRASIALAGAGPVPIRLSRAEGLVVGQKAADVELADVIDVAHEINVMEDAHASADYRRHLAGVLTEQALQQAIASIGSSRVVQ